MSTDPVSEQLSILDEAIKNGLIEDNEEGERDDATESNAPIAPQWSDGSAGS